MQEHDLQLPSQEVIQQQMRDHRIKVGWQMSKPVLGLFVVAILVILVLVSGSSKTPNSQLDLFSTYYHDLDIQPLFRFNQLQSSERSIAVQTFALKNNRAEQSFASVDRLHTGQFQVKKISSSPHVFCDICRIGNEELVLEVTPDSVNLNKWKSGEPLHSFKNSYSTWTWRGVIDTPHNRLITIGFDHPPVYTSSEHHHPGAGSLRVTSFDGLEHRRVYHFPHAPFAIARDRFCDTVAVAERKGQIHVFKNRETSLEPVAHLESGNSFWQIAGDCLRLSPNGNSLAFVDSKDLMLFYSIDSGKPKSLRRTLQNGRIGMPVAFIDDDKVVYFGGDLLNKIDLKSDPPAESTFKVDSFEVYAIEYNSMLLKNSVFLLGKMGDEVDRCVQTFDFDSQILTRIENGN